MRRVGRPVHRLESLHRHIHDHSPQARRRSRLSSPPRCRQSISRSSVMTGRTLVRVSWGSLWLTDTPSVPSDVRHFVFWTRVPLIHPAIVPSAIWDRIVHDGLWGFTGGDREATYPISVDQDAHTMEMVRKAHKEVDEFVLEHWLVIDWETAWFVNPPVSLINLTFHLPTDSLIETSKHTWPSARPCVCETKEYECPSQLATDSNSFE